MVGRSQKRRFNLLTIKGVVFLSNAPDNAEYWVKVARTQDQCSIRYRLDDRDEDAAEMLYKKISLTCG
ncbi:hypothetical protein BBW68_12375 [Candidatus Erwinia dacicola]|uniref:Uncharacterized protein n=1 Tax=Candidatus Erwinia dacicola TaxID=252393 RepID=A0A1E7YYF6_9GAMM|nr:hypothetical protein BBW68_12375 [Candidatus Erwinia dacicola]